MVCRAAPMCALLVALLACKKTEPKAEAPAATPSAPAPAAAPTPAAEPSARQAAPAAPPKVTTPTQEVPEIPAGKSNPPKGNEWDEGVVINTQGKTTWPPRCQMRVLREWLRVHCSGDVVGHEKMEGFGVKGSDYYFQLVPNKYASLVTRMKRGDTLTLRICREKSRASLFVSWPGGSDRPKHIALGKGPACDGSDWGAGYGGKAKASAAKGDTTGGEEDEEEVLRRLREQDDAYYAMCKAGNALGCFMSCGEPTCD